MLIGVAVVAFIMGICYILTRNCMWRFELHLTATMSLSTPFKILKIKIFATKSRFEVSVNVGWVVYHRNIISSSCHTLVRSDYCSLSHDFKASYQSIYEIKIIVPTKNFEFFLINQKLNLLPSERTLICWNFNGYFSVLNHQNTSKTMNKTKGYYSNYWSR